MNGKNGYFIRCIFMNALNVDYSPDFFISAASRGNKSILVSDWEAFQRLFISAERNHSSLRAADQRPTRNGEGNSPSLSTTVRGAGGAPPPPLR